MRVVVRDIDDNVPAFSKRNITLGVRLNVPIDTSLLTLEAVDADADSEAMRYWLAGASFHPLTTPASHAADLAPGLDELVQGVFRLDAETGELRTAASMQQFVDGYFTLRVAAANVHGPEANNTRRANATVKVCKFVFFAFSPCYPGPDPSPTPTSGGWVSSPNIRN